MLAGIRDVLIITTPHDAEQFNKLLGNGSQWGINLQYAVQPSPDGLAQAFIIGREFINRSRCCLILGDNIFYGHRLQESLASCVARESGATVFGYWVKDPERYGVAEFDESGRVVRLVEKPKQPKSHYAITGLYFYDENVVDLAGDLLPSSRGELEITDLNNLYLNKQNLHVEKLGRGVAWLDTGTHLSLMQASNFIQIIEERQGLKVGCPEEIAFTRRWIDADQLEKQAQQLISSSYGGYLMQLLNQGKN